MYKHQWAV